jgi:glycosyltransferase involved in cell wall biosynthesis
MRILLQNRDEKGHFGGDMVQLHAYEQALKKLGHEAVYSSAMFNQDVSGFDMAWLFHVNFGWSWLQYQSLQGLPYFLFAIFYPQEFDVTKGQMRELAENAKAVFFLSNKEKEEFEAFVGPFLKYNPVVVNNGVNKDLFYPGQEERKYVFSCGRLESGKGHLKVIQACKELQIPVVVAGSLGDQTYKDFCIAENYGQILNNIPYDQIGDYYRKAKVFVNASESERCSLTLIEASACGCGIVATTENRGNEWFGDKLETFNPWNMNDLKEKLWTQWNVPTSLEDKIISWEDTVKQILEHANI